jgi:hypothetical protein
MGKRSVAYSVWVGKRVERRPLKWKDNIKMDLRRWVGAWTGLDMDRLRALVNVVMNFRFS